MVLPFYKPEMNMKALSIHKLAQVLWIKFHSHYKKRWGIMRKNVNFLRYEDLCLSHGLLCQHKILKKLNKVWDIKTTAASPNCTMYQFPFCSYETRLKGKTLHINRFAHRQIHIIEQNSFSWMWPTTIILSNCLEIQGSSKVKARYEGHCPNVLVLLESNH